MVNAASLPATPAVLARRLRELGATTLMMLDAAQARSAIEEYRCHWAVCARINGKISTFQRYFEACYGVALDGKPLKASRSSASAGS
jgi:hypothetical protein